MRWRWLHSGRQMRLYNHLGGFLSLIGLTSRSYSIYHQRRLLWLFNLLEDTLGLLQHLPVIRLSLSIRLGTSPLGSDYSNRVLKVPVVLVALIELALIVKWYRRRTLRTHHQLSSVDWELLLGKPADGLLAKLAESRLTFTWFHGLKLPDVALLLLKYGVSCWQVTLVSVFCLDFDFNRTRQDTHVDIRHIGLVSLYDAAEVEIFLIFFHFGALIGLATQ